MGVHGFELGYRVHGFQGTGTWFREYGVPGSESTGYIVLRVRGA